MTEKSSRVGAYEQAGAGIGLLAAGELAGAKLRGSGIKHAKVLSHVAPRGLAIAGVPLAAHGILSATRGAPADRVSVRDAAHDVAEGTVSVPGLHRKGDPKQDLKETAAVTGAALAGGYGAKRIARARKLGHGRTALLGATGAALGGAIGTAATRHVNKADVDDGALSPEELRRRQWRRKRRSMYAGLATTVTGGTALALRAPNLARQGTKLRAIAPKTTHLSNQIAGAAATVGVGSGIATYLSQHHDLQHEQEQIAHQKVRKDRFLDEHRDRISPSAEAGYEYLRRGRNRQRGKAAASAVFTGINVPAALHGGKVTRPLGIAGMAISGTDMVRNAQGAHRWNAKMGKIKAKAHERAAAGEWGKDRQVEVGKALWKRPPGLPLPKGLVRKPALRPGHLMRTSTGETVTVRASFS